MVSMDSPPRQMPIWLRHRRFFYAGTSFLTSFALFLHLFTTIPSMTHELKDTKLSHNGSLPMKVTQPFSQDGPSHNPDLSVLEKCTPDQLEIIQTQLPPEDCLKHQKRPWLQLCSLSYATRCPEATWLQDFYTHNHHSKKSQCRNFIGVFIGCNKGMDAVNAMRMGSGNPIFDKFQWKHAMTLNGTLNLSFSVCDQDATPQFELEDQTLDPSLSSSLERSQLHCIEPMPSTSNALSQSAHQLAWDQRGFIVTHAAMSRKDGFILFPSGTGVGIENKGIGNCERNHQDCVNVTMYSLDTFVTKFVPADMPINYLSVDVEGFDMDVLLGGSQHALARVQYLEFEYNWMGAWRHQHLLDLIILLDSFGFTCYWPGFNNTIWRITNCWLDYYDVHIWSNVACVNRNFEEVRQMAENMENMFLETLSKGREVVMDQEHQFRPSR